MKIGLVDVDSHNFPNLPLMKLSAWHKAQGDTVEFLSNYFEHYDKVYVSKVFGDEYSQMDMTCINADEIVYGGTGSRVLSGCEDLPQGIASETAYIKRFTEVV